MGEKKGNTEGYVKKETVIIVAVIMLIAGFLAGVMTTVYKSNSKVPSQAADQHQHQEEPAEKQQTVPTELAVKIFELEKKLAESPPKFDQWLQLGNLYFDTNNHEKAIIAYNKHLEKDPNNPDVLTDLGVMYRKDGQSTEAIAAFDKAIKADPSHEQSRFNKGVVLMHDLNNIEGAVKEWEGLVAINPNAMSPSGMSVSELLKKFKQNDGGKE
jgi:cytochrome c-type biogenesis protein CcmH/NrfG